MSSRGLPDGDASQMQLRVRAQRHEEGETTFVGFYTHVPLLLGDGDTGDLHVLVSTSTCRRHESERVVSLMCGRGVPPHSTRNQRTKARQKSKKTAAAATQITEKLQATSKTHRSLSAALARSHKQCARETRSHAGAVVQILGDASGCVGALRLLLLGGH